jgi:nicotinic acid phosphoribosyltransferase
VAKIDVKFTDGRKIETIRFDSGDDVTQVGRFTDWMRGNGFRPIPAFRGGVKIRGHQTGGGLPASIVRAR